MDMAPTSVRDDADPGLPQSDSLCLIPSSRYRRWETLGRRKGRESRRRSRSERRWPFKYALLPPTSPDVAYVIHVDISDV